MSLPSETPAPAFVPPTPPRGRQKWVRHGLSNSLVYGGLFYGAVRLPLPVLRGISLVGNAIATRVLKQTMRDVSENFRLAFGVDEATSRRMARALFHEYGHTTVDLWRVRSGARELVPRIRSFIDDGVALHAARHHGRGPIIVSGHFGNWEMGAVVLTGHGFIPAVLGQPELDPTVHEMRLRTRARMGVETIDIGTSMATSLRVRTAVERGRVIALVADRAYPEDQVEVPFFGRPTPFLRSPALLARFCRCNILPGFFLRDPDGSYRSVFAPPLSPDPSLSPEEDSRRMMTAFAAAFESLVREHPTQWFNFFRFWNGGAGGTTEA